MVLEKKNSNEAKVIRFENNTNFLKETKEKINYKKKNIRAFTLHAKQVKVGDICNLKITAIVQNNIGIDEYSLPFAVFVPNAQLGSQIQAKIVKIQDSSGKYAIAKMVEEKNKDIKLNEAFEKQLSKISIKPGDVLTVSIKKQMENGKAGIVELADNYRLIVPLTDKNLSSKKLENITVKVTRLKLNYGFAKIQNENKTSSDKKIIEKLSANNLEIGSKFTTTLPLSSLKSFTFTKGLRNSGLATGKFIVLKIKGLNDKESILFVKIKKNGIYAQRLIANGKLRVRIKITSKSSNCFIGKILQLTNPPISKNQKKSYILNNIREMINHGMHFGEKAVKCDARMKNYIWLSRSQNTKLNKIATIATQKKGLSNLNKNTDLSKEERPLIKKGRHVINLLKTRRCLNQALKKVTKYALKGRTFLFIGTKKPASGLVARASFFTKNSFYVNTRWLGGLLTNWKTICKSISKIRPILKEKQKVVRDILERRQTIKNRLIKKALLLKKKSKLILSKGRILLETLKKDKDSQLTNTKNLIVLRNEFMNKGIQYLEKRQKLIQKRKELIYQTFLLKEKGLDLSLKYNNILNQLAIYTKKLREYKYLLILISEIQQMKSRISTSTNSNLVSISYGKFKELNKQNNKSEQQNSSLDWIVPNPPKEILNRIVLAMKNQNNSTLISKGMSASLTQTQQNNLIVCSTLLSKFSNFSIYIKNIIKSLITSIKVLETQAKNYTTQLTQIKEILNIHVVLKNKIVVELQQLQIKFIKERSLIRIIKRKLNTLDAQKKLLKFLPRLRYLPTSQTKISEIVQILLSRIVDPKLKYPIETIYDQKLSNSSKKLAAIRKKKWQRLEKYFGGIANMTKLTKTQISRNVAIIIGQKEEMNAVRECQKLGIKMFTIMDTNCNPSLSDHIIPANDDSRSSIKYILTKFITRIRLAQKLRSRLTIYMNK